MGGAEAPSYFRGSLPSVSYKLGGASDGENATVEVNNVLVTKQLHNVFGIIKGFTDPGVCVRERWPSTRIQGSVKHCVFISVCVFQISMWCWGHKGIPGVLVMPRPPWEPLC